MWPPGKTHSVPKTLQTLQTKNKRQKNKKQRKNKKHKPKSKSRRITQRCVKQNNKLNKQKQNAPFKNSLNLTKIRCFSNYGFCANPKHTLQLNFNNAIHTETPTPHSQPTNLAFHNLCTQNVTPVGTKQLLGLNLNYCLATKQIPNNMNKPILKMAYSIRTKFYLNCNNSSTDTEYIKQLYKKNTTWNPPPAPNITEEKITQFEKAVKTKQQKLTAKNAKIHSSILTPIQIKALLALHNNKNLIIKPTDKNLGPALMDLDSYVK
jgi:hypothetical protein